MNSRDENIFRNVFGSHNRRDFLKHAGALGLSAGAFSAFLEACGSTTSNVPSNVNMAGPIDMATLAAKAREEGKLQAIGIPPEWADYADILEGYAKKYVQVQYKAEAE
ncbi:MAG TPA: twin-arginine translocation signal domain-containing protein, partial [Ktedonobacteraceae bacterium]|nr:twin-arginine translocation signal domain-containing protein [Ktedonobacteraceae bacterium]